MLQLQLPISHRWSGAPDKPFSDEWKEHGLRLFVRNTFIDVEDTYAEASRSSASRRGSRSCVARICGDTLSRMCSEDQRSTTGSGDAIKEGASSSNAAGDRDDETVSLPSEDAEDTASSATGPWAPEDDPEEWASSMEDDSSQVIMQTPVTMPLTAAMGFGCWPQSADGWYSMPAVGTAFPAPYEYTKLGPMPVAAVASPQQLLPAPPMYYAPVFPQQEESAAPPPGEVPTVASIPEFDASPQPTPRDEEARAEDAARSEEEAPLASEGSRLHGTVNEDMQPACQPCAWFYKRSGCKNGAECFYCHLCPKEELKTRKKDKVMRLRQQQQ
jgi:hypothetical protein